MLAAIRRYLWLGLLAFTSGCAMCGSCDDETYGAYGGRWERLDQCYGRVGSAFTPEVGTQVTPGVGPTPAEKAKPVEEAMPAEEAKPVEEANPGEQVKPIKPMPADDPFTPAPQPLPDEDVKSTDASVLREPVQITR